MFLLDTNVVSELRKGPRSHTNVQAWNAGVSEQTCWISAVTLFELHVGALGRRRADPAQGDALLRWIGQVRGGFDGRILDVTTDDWIRCASLHVPHPRPLRDSLIATCAAARGLAVVTRNEVDFEGLGVAVVNPWR